MWCQDDSYGRIVHCTIRLDEKKREKETKKGEKK
jgi:hypothetical protein